MTYRSLSRVFTLARAALVVIGLTALGLGYLSLPEGAGPAVPDGARAAASAGSGQPGWMVGVAPPEIDSIAGSREAHASGTVDAYQPDRLDGARSRHAPDRQR